MAEEQHTTSVPAAEETEIKDRGLFDFLGKKEEEKPQEEVIATKLDQVHIAECEDKKEDEEEKKHTSLLEKMHQDDSSSSSSSSEEEVEEGGEKIRRKKKKGLKEKIQEKISGEKEEEKKVEAEDTSIPIEKVDHGVIEQPEEKKSFIEKIKDKLPGHKKPEDSTPVATPTPTPTPTPAPAAEYAPSDEHAHDAEPKEKKGLLEKIKEKMPGYHKTEEEKKETTTEH